MSSTNEWRDACAAADVVAGTPLLIQLEGIEPLTAYRLGDEIFVTDDTCTHGKASLSEGYVEGEDIECPWHSGRFSIRTGKPTQLPACEALRTWQVKLEGGRVLVRPNED